MKLYYKLVLDAIIPAMKKGDDMWKFTLFILFSILHGLNLMTVLIYCKIHLPSIRLFEKGVFNSLLGGIVYFILPFSIIVYLLIFRNNRYEELIEKFPMKKEPKGLRFVSYMFLTFLLFIGPIIIKMIGER